MAKNAPKSNLPEGFVPVALPKSAGFYVVKEGNTVQGILRDVLEQDDPFNKGAKRFAFRVELTKGGTTVMTDKTERKADVGELIGVDEKGYLRAIRDVEKGREIFIRCTGKQAAKDVKMGRSAAWLFDIVAMPF